MSTAKDPDETVDDSTTLEAFVDEHYDELETIAASDLDANWVAAALLAGGDGDA